MSDNARRSDATPPSGRPEPFGLQAYLDRQREEFERAGPTVAELLAEFDEVRAGGVPRELISQVVREDRDA